MDGYCFCFSDLWNRFSPQPGDNIIASIDLESHAIQIIRGTGKYIETIPCGLVNNPFGDDFGKKINVFFFFTTKFVFFFFFYEFCFRSEAYYFDISKCVWKVRYSTF